MSLKPDLNQPYNMNLITLCNKENILLQKDKNSNIFYIDFDCENKNISIKKIINLKLYNIIYQLNTDLFDNIHVDKINKKEANILFLFKSLGKEVGIKKKFLYTKTKIEKNKDIIQFKTLDQKYNNKNDIINTYQKINSNYENLVVKKINKHKIQVQYMFKYDIKEDLPIYMENIMGFMMKKIFYRLKKFIENLNSLN